MTTSTKSQEPKVGQKIGIKEKLHRVTSSEFFYNYKRNVPAIIGSIIIFIALFLAIFGPAFAPQNPYDLTEIDLADAYKPPVWQEGGDSRFILGTDDQGRDIVSGIIYGSRISLFIGLTVTILSCFIGTTLGLLAGYYGGKIDSFIMRIADIQLSFPSMLIALFIMSAFGRGVDKLLFALTLVGWVIFARTVRGETLSVKKKEFIEATRVIGLPDRKIIPRHVLPNVFTSVIVISTIKVGDFILTEATLSFLGVGVPITEPSLGLLVKNGFDVLFSGLWWVSVFPGFYIMLLVFGINLLGDFLRDELNPKLK
ncbi:MAG: ABC transporter permease [Maledivibacter sp.]|jgi:peptide/nickel transport system permease protein|nr:ABC transporter permease [Maledivibacter sp.]